MSFKKRLNENENVLEILYAEITNHLVQKIQKTTEVSKRRSIPYGMLYTIRPFKNYIDNILRMNRDLSRKKEKALLLALRFLPQPNSEKDDKKESKRISNMLKRYS